ncbi:hypothetical protein JT362_10895 [Actinophytocola sp. S1-96]|uniref:YCII-related domain-containing protein n=2 Tax=Actinophytocola gossypii TaxID=2812003 RepID=A0ABT2J750_9PSEU|nr:hypothetical protein [Actinophytocola gossypii]
MKYMILTLASQLDYESLSGKPGSAWTDEDFAALRRFMTDLNKDLTESGELVETRGLAAPVHSRRLRLREGVPVVTDGPYAETEEVLAGYWIVECASYDRATEIAARIVDGPGPDSDRENYVVDVRPLVDSADDLAD